MKFALALLSVTTLLSIASNEAKAQTATHRAFGTDAIYNCEYVQNHGWAACETAWIRQHMAHPNPAVQPKYDMSTFTINASSTDNNLIKALEKLGVSNRGIDTWIGAHWGVPITSLIGVAYCFDDADWNKIKDHVTWKGSTAF